MIDWSKATEADYQILENCMLQVDLKTAGPFYARLANLPTPPDWSRFD